MGFLLRDSALLFESYGYFRLRNSPAKPCNVTLLVQLPGKDEAELLARQIGKKAYPFRDRWTVYVTGIRLHAWLAAFLAFGYLCLAHARVVELIIEIHRLNASRKTRSRKSIHGKLDEHGRRVRGKAAKRSDKRDVAERAAVWRRLEEAVGRLRDECPFNESGWWRGYTPPVKTKPEFTIEDDTYDGYTPRLAGGTARRPERYADSTPARREEEETDWVAERRSKIRAAIRAEEEEQMKGRRR